MSRTKRALKNSIFNMLQQIVSIITNIILPPIIIASFGSTINGFIATIKQLMKYTQLVGAGLSASTIESLYKPLSEKNEKEISGIVNATNIAFNSAGIWFSIITVIISCIYPYLVKTTSINNSTITLLTIIIGITGASEFFVIGKYRTLLTADQKIFVVSITQMLGNILNLIVAIILIYLQKDIITVQLCSSIVYASRIIVLILYVHKNYKFLDNQVEPILAATSKRKDALFHQLTTTIVSGSSTILVSIFCGLEAASIYSVYGLVFIGINALCSVISNALVPSFGELIAKDNIKILKKTFNLYELIYFVVIFTLFSVAFLVIIPFVTIYTKGLDINYIKPNLAILFVCVGIISNLKIPSDTIITAHGHFKETKHFAKIELIINILGQLIFVIIFGLEGILLGTVFSYLYRTTNNIIYANQKILNISNITTLKRVIVNFLATFTSLYILSNIYELSCNNYIDWIIKSGFCTIFIGLILLLYNYLFDRQTVRNLFKRIKILLT